MKKFTLALGLLVFVLGNSFASADEEKVPSDRLPHFGIEGGFNLSSFTTADPNIIYSSRLGFVGGGFLILPMGGGLRLQPEVLYSQKGGRINGNDYQLAYVEVPVLLNVSLFGPLNLLAGPTFNANVATPTGVTVNNADVGLMLGGQFAFASFLFSGRYEIGLLDLDSNAKIQNGTFTLLVGLCLI